METIMTRHPSARFTMVLGAVLLMSGSFSHASSSNGVTTADAQHRVDKVLAAMDRTSTWGHPDLFNEFAGMHQLEAGHYKSAMNYLKTSSLYADKLSQLSVGLMYLNGQGVTKDPVTAFAWVAISAERKYPRFLATRDAIWAGLDASQREQAKVLLAKLYTKYGDPTAKPRMVRAMNRARSQMTGSLLGFGSPEVITVSTGNPPPACGGDTIDGAPQTGCGNIYASWRWDPKKYFQSRDGAWEGTVTVGSIDRAGAAAVTTVKPDDARKDMEK